MTTYKDAGVDVQATDALVNDISSFSKSTKRKGSVDSIGGFGGIFDLKQCGYKDPLLVSGTDGIGTKILLGIEINKLDGLGYDLVGMCLNDILCHGADPLFFLDYYASSKVDKTSFLQIIKSITEACKQNDCSLIGGETAEMPGLYKENDFDFAGFCVGAVERDNLLPKHSLMKKGDLLFGIHSSGFHSNGYSLIRKVIKDHNIQLEKTPDFETNHNSIGDALMSPTTLYYPILKDLIKYQMITGVSHITGGGVIGNVPRMLPNNLKATIHKGNINPNGIFGWLQNIGNITDTEMLKTFNCGLGIVLSVQKNNYKHFINTIADKNLPIFEIGHIDDNKINDRCQII